MTTLSSLLNDDEKRILDVMLERRRNETARGMIAMKAFISRFTKEEAVVWKKYLEYYKLRNEEAAASMRKEFGDS